jgi:hypothetical protein
MMKRRLDVCDNNPALKRNCCFFSSTLIARRLGHLLSVLRGGCGGSAPPAAMVASTPLGLACKSNLTLCAAFVCVPFAAFN